MAKLGTVEWLEAGHGKLALCDKLTLIVQGMRAKAAAKKRQNAVHRIRALDIDTIRPPDTPIAREAMTLCGEASEPFLFNHCLRSYYWSHLLNDGTESFDDEAVFTALMLHDMGLTEQYRLRRSEHQCFTVVGARMADDLARKHHWTDKRANIMANAITLHLNVIVDENHGKEAQMVRAGSGADVAGLGLELLHDEQIHAVCGKHPRLGMKRRMRSALRTETRERPDCRIAFLNHRFGFDKLISSTPVFDE
ncbi:MAG: HD domain-containing protein [Candidatus Thiodiazotropha sp.]